MSGGEVAFSREVSTVLRPYLARNLWRIETETADDRWVYIHCERCGWRRSVILSPQKSSYPGNLAAQLAEHEFTCRTQEEVQQ